MVQEIHPWGVTWVPITAPMLVTCQKKKWRLSCLVSRCPWINHTSYRQFIMHENAGTQFWDKNDGEKYGQAWVRCVIINKSDGKKTVRSRVEDSAVDYWAVHVGENQKQTLLYYD